jgi:hypothetical protein
MHHDVVDWNRHASPVRIGQKLSNFTVDFRVIPACDCRGFGPQREKLFAERDRKGWNLANAVRKQERSS